MRQRALAKRIIALEKALAPPPKIIWSPWQRLLDDGEYGLVMDLASRGARHGGNPKDVSPGCDAWGAWRALCVDDDEREALDSIRSKAGDEPRWRHLGDLRR